MPICRVAACRRGAKLIEQHVKSASQQIVSIVDVIVTR